MDYSDIITVDNIKALRKKKGLKQTQVAERLGHKSSKKISNWETHRSVPSRQGIEKLAIIFKVSIEEITKEAEIESSFKEEPEENNIIGRNIRAARISKGWTQIQLAEKLTERKKELGLKKGVSPPA